MNIVNQSIYFPEKDKAAVEINESSVELENGEALVKNIYSVISPGTELGQLQGTTVTRSGPVTYPHRSPGYCSIVEVIESRSDALQKGQRILASVSHSLYSLVQGNSVGKWLPLPENLKIEEAAFAPLVRIGYTGVAVINILFGQRVLVIGQGIIGNFAAQWYKNSNALSVNAVDLSEERASFSREKGIAACVPQNLEQKEFDIVVEATGSIKGLESAFDYAREGGAVVLLGTTRDIVENFDFTNKIHRKLLTVLGAHTNMHTKAVSVKPAQPLDDPLELSMKYIAEGKIDVKGFTGNTFSSADCQKAYDEIVNQKCFTSAFDWTKI
ncbi:MAG: zinc-dependent alcohol dehydrogenase [Planctomycetota bacterium]|jgi:threonine dehydrogenase-like Zn-dependent dehydrogenase